MAENNTARKNYDDVNVCQLSGRLTEDAKFQTGEKDGRKWKQVRFSFGHNIKGNQMFVNCSLFVPESYQGKGLVKGARVVVTGQMAVKMGEKKAFIDLTPLSLDTIFVADLNAAPAKAAEPAAESSTTDEDIPF